MKHLYSKYHQWIDYIFVGVLTTIINFGVFFLFDTIFGISYLIANAISIVVAILFAFYMNKKYVFKSRTTDRKVLFREFTLFVGFRLGSGFYDMLSMWVLVAYFSLNTNVSKLLTEVVVVLLNYAFSKFIVFRKRNTHA
ncbi:GtrA family protein [Alkalibacterium sp. 20]|uniref:GtrA family protein n=1 Tax=Alkalibacterium sp. 20 TaxID=1798803 RepID=UPI0009002D7A|nr:GtrA family protein [Alkalibacterium sp. 20]OJF92137.1 teichoic acid glycosylation protein [Alkalibacterium sp. 20]